MMVSFKIFMVVFSLAILAALPSTSAKPHYDQFKRNLNVPMLSFDDSYSQLFGDSNLLIHRDGKTVHLFLDKKSGAGFVSQDLYLHGFFSASIKLPSDYTAGVVVAFYMSNGDKYEKNHDELDFEFLGNIRGKEWRIQTNVYGNGSSNVGREERYGLWFDPTEHFHQYSILWTENQIIFFVDNVPIRETLRTEAMNGDFPSKPMSLYATIWDGSNWATNGGKYRVNYRYAPYVAEFSDFILHGCAVDPIQQSPKCDSNDVDALQLTTLTTITKEQRTEMKNFRKNYMTYSYCYDFTRYPKFLPECVIDPREAQRLQRFDPVTFGNGHRYHRKRHHHNGAGGEGSV